MLTVEQPTGGVILVNDTRPDEEKSLMELKAKKKAQPAAAAPGSSSRGPQMGNDPFSRGGGEDQDMMDAIQSSLTGAAAGAGVLTAVDEDEEGGEEAPVPDEFEVDEDEAETQDE